MFGKLIKLLFDKEQMKEPLDMSEKKEQSAKAPTVHESLIPSFGKELAQQVTTALTIWTTLSLFGVIKLPFIGRTELIAVCYWLLIILHNLCLYLWAAYRGITRIAKVSASKFAWPFIGTIFIGYILVESRTQINLLNTYFSQVAFCIVFVYPIFLYLIASIKKKYVAKRRTLNEEG